MPGLDWLIYSHLKCSGMRTRLFLMLSLPMLMLTQLLAQGTIAGPKLVCSEDLNTYTLVTDLDLSECDVTWFYGNGVDHLGQVGNTTGRNLKSVYISFPDSPGGNIVSVVISNCGNSEIIEFLTVYTFSVFAMGIPAEDEKSP